MLEKHVNSTGAAFVDLGKIFSNFGLLALDRICSAIPLFGTYQREEKARGLLEAGRNSFFYSISRIFKPSCRLSDSRRDGRVDLRPR